MADAADTKSVLPRVLVSLGLIVAFVAVGAAIFAGLATLRKPPNRDATPPPRTMVKVQRAERSSYRETLTGYGRARALRKAEVSSELAAVVLRISPDLAAGTPVEGGYPLVFLDDRDARSAKDSADARLDRANAELSRLRAETDSVAKQLVLVVEEVESSRRELARLERLAEQKHTSASVVDAQSLQVATRRAAQVVLEGRQVTIAAQIQAAAADVQAALADQRRADDDLARAVVKAPFAGVIETRLVDAGSRVSPGTPLFRLVDPSQVEVPIALPASRFGDVEAGSRATIRLTGGTTDVWTGKVARIAPGVDPTQRTFLAYLEVRADRGRSAVPPGAFVVATIHGREYRDVFVVPRAAFIADRIYIAKPEEDDLALVEERRPEVLRLLTDVALVSGGIEVGEQVVITSIEHIAAGGRVRIAPPEQAER